MIRLHPSSLSFALRRNIPTLIGLALSLYFGYHALWGQRGLVTFHALSRVIEDSSQTLAVLHAEHDHLEKRVIMLRPATLDKDMLEERVRATLAYVHPQDHIILDAPSF